jgi:hypothetical protein
MSALLDQVSTDGKHHTTVLNLYCWPHNAVHAFPVADVEEIVYALAADPTDSYRSGWDDRAAAELHAVRHGGPVAGPTEGHPGIPCLKEVLKNWARDSEVYAEHVEQGVGCRKAAVIPDA